ncbi:hypothetical protein [Fervidibacillus albus]|uniref:YneQ n=1 Tax=Fervidibacillus albus TaxID=2980026 RepID=A0A9E8LY41_9BACI|nr:hypothetical protein [Fervidibacillus albus]WAA10899.1 hypothetical protein OE104_06185 [Fervidibacillus albus]
MAFGITKKEVAEWKEKIDRNEIAFLTHLWTDQRFPGMKTVTKVGCKDLQKLKRWGERYGLKPEWIHVREEGYSHFDLIGPREKEILKMEGIPYPFDQ